VLDRITPLLLTFDEAANIRRTLGKLNWAREIVVVDSGSTDGTREILREYQNVRVFERPFVGHADQWTFALRRTEIGTDWVLALDADYVLSDALIEELAALTPFADVAGYEARFVYCVNGRPLRGSVYPPKTVLYRRTRAMYRQDGHTQRIAIDGRVDMLLSPIYHDDRKPLRRWLRSQARYMRLECEKLITTPFWALRMADRARRLIIFAPPAMFFYCLFIKRGLLDGIAGLRYAFERATAEAVLSLFLLQKIARGSVSKQ
jgi:glycosyltransferase involved in cell wall biosynthesis